jgi:site-specific recombinase XerD
VHEKEPARRSLAELISEYAEYLRHEQHASAVTQTGYRSQLNRFRRFIIARYGREPDVSELAVADVRDYLYSLSRTGLRPRTLRGAMCPVRNLFTLALERGYRPDNPALSVRLPRKDAPVRATVSDEEIARLLSGVEREPDAARRTMMRAVLAVLVYTALRRQELLDLEVSDIDLHERRLTVRRGKGSKRRAVPLSQDCARALREWLDLRRTLGCRHSGLFITDRGRRLGENGLSKIIEATRAMADLREHTHITPHAIRHAAATRMLRNGADLRSIQHILGHTNLHTTQVYLHTDEQQLQRVAELTALGEVKRTSAPAPAGRRRRDAEREGRRGAGEGATRRRRLYREDRRRR